MKTRALAVLSLLVFAGMAPARTQSPSFSTKVESVRVDVLVAENGQPVAGLGPSDFEVLDNGVRQQVDLVSFDQIPLNVILAFDMSYSVAGERFEHLRAGGRAVLSGLAKDDQGALVTFSHIVALGAGLTKNAAAVETALDEARATGDTALIDGVHAAMTLGESDAGRALLIVFSDGLDTTAGCQPTPSSKTPSAPTWSPTRSRRAVRGTRRSSGISRRSPAGRSTRSTRPKT